MIDHVVKSGDTLYSIAWSYGYDPRKVAGWNNIPPPYTIYPGQHIYIIPPYQKNARQAPRREQIPSRRSPATNPVSKPVVTATNPQQSENRSNKRKALENKPKHHYLSKIKWRWPTDGKIVNRFSPSDGKKGVDIGGKNGQPIFAAASGNVVYSGNSLIGYGNLIIIKHNETYLSAYGHNRRLLVKEGDVVRQGQKIAEMGDSSKDGVVLHFEIRREGKPVDPSDYLPQQEARGNL